MAFAATNPHVFVFLPESLLSAYAKAETSTAAAVAASGIDGSGLPEHERPRPTRVERVAENFDDGKTESLLKSLGVTVESHRTAETGVFEQDYDFVFDRTIRFLDDAGKKRSRIPIEVSDEFYFLNKRTGAPYTHFNVWSAEAARHALAAVGFSFLREAASREKLFACVVAAGVKTASVFAYTFGTCEAYNNPRRIGLSCCLDEFLISYPESHAFAEVMVKQMSYVNPFAVAVSMTVLTPLAFRGDLISGLCAAHAKKTSDTPRVRWQPVRSGLTPGDVCKVVEECLNKCSDMKVVRRWSDVFYGKQLPLRSRLMPLSQILRETELEERLGLLVDSFVASLWSIPAKLIIDAAHVKRTTFCAVAGDNSDTVFIVASFAVSTPHVPEPLVQGDLGVFFVKNEGNMEMSISRLLIEAEPRASYVVRQLATPDVL
jgi:hypothetical protein